MEIAIRGKFSLRYKTYLGDYKATMKDIDIVKWQEENSCYTIADFNEDGELVSCGSRLLDAIENTKDLKDIRELEEIGTAIIVSNDKVEV